MKSSPSAYRELVRKKLFQVNREGGAEDSVPD